MNAKLFFFVSFFLFLLSAAHYSARAEISQPEYFPPYHPTPIPAPAYPYPPSYPMPYPNYGYPFSGWSYSTCATQTVCPNGMPISCWASGNYYAGAACYFHNYPGYSVECTGFNAFGQWITSWARCY